MKRIWKNDEQIKGFAGILDNLSVVAIAAWVIPFFGFNQEGKTTWIMFAISLAGVGCAYGAFCLRKLLRS
jgi:hypothetical protein